METDGVGEPILSVVIPAYNEEKRLKRTLEATRAYLEQRAQPYEVLIVDDGSRDATFPVTAEWASAHSCRWGVFRPLRYEENRGKGYAVRFGVLRASGKRILFMDADLATPLEELEKLEALLVKDESDTSGIQVAIGSRPLPESELLVHQPWYREAAGRTFNAFVQLLATPGIKDTQCGFKLFTAQAARAIFSRCRLDGFSFDVEVLFLARRLGLSVAEIPVRWAHQEGAAAFATSGAYLRHGLRMLVDLCRIRWMHRSVRSGRATTTPAATPPHA